MKKRLDCLVLILYIFLLIGVSLVPASAANVTVGVPERAQEHSQWCWAGSSKAVLDYYAKSVNQCSIANWAWSRTDCCGNTVFNWSHPCNQPNSMYGTSGSLQDILSHWGVNSTSQTSALPWYTVVSEINAKRPFVMRFGWTSGGGHFLDGYGYDDSGSGYVHYMDPWPGNGYTKALYSTTVSATDHTWTHTLRVTTTPVVNKAVMTSPVNGSTLASTTQTFVWSNVGATYWLYLGTSPGASNIYNQSTGTATSRTVSGLPSNGSMIYARLWTYSGGTWLYNDYSYKAYGGGSKAVMTSPVNGSTLASTTQTFVWSNVGATYWLYLGTSPGASNIYNQSTGTATSRTVSGLPSNGSMIYARLWTYSGGTWLYNDYSYKAYGGGSKAVMTSPVNGSTLASTTQTFVWTNVGASQYWLYLGTSPGANNMYSKSMGTSTSITLSGLPSNGSIIYVRLWTLSGSTWLYNDYSYRAYSGGSKAVMTSPVNGSTLASTTQTFVWTNVGASQYWLYLGTSPGAYNMYSKSMGTATSITLSGLPSNGSIIYVRLWTLSGSTWLYNDYSYRAYSGGSKAVMISPANGSTLTSTTQTFVWTNVGAPQYWLYVGTSPGAYNMYSKSMGTATSITLYGFPSNGSMFYVRLWTLSGSTWLYNDYSYRTYSAYYNTDYSGADLYVDDSENSPENMEPTNGDGSGVTQ